MVTGNSCAACAPGKPSRLNLVVDRDLRQIDEVHDVGEVVERQFPQGRSVAPPVAVPEIGLPQNRPRPGSPGRGSGRELRSTAFSPPRYPSDAKANRKSIWA